MASKVVFVALMVLFSLGTMPALMTASRVDVAALLSSIDFPTAKTKDSSWCMNCVCTESLPPNCRCPDVFLCAKCVCYRTVKPELKPFCELLAGQFPSFCLDNTATTKTIQAILA